MEQMAQKLQSNFVRIRDCMHIQLICGVFRFIFPHHKRMCSVYTFCDDFATMRAIYNYPTIDYFSFCWRLLLVRLQRTQMENRIKTMCNNKLRALEWVSPSMRHILSTFPTICNKCKWQIAIALSAIAFGGVARPLCAMTHNGDCF